MVGRIPCREGTVMFPRAYEQKLFLDSMEDGEGCRIHWGSQAGVAGRMQ